MDAGAKPALLAAVHASVVRYGSLGDTPRSIVFIHRDDLRDALLCVVAREVANYRQRVSCEM